MKQIAVLTSGGDAPGMNAAIRAVTRSALDQGMTVSGVLQGWEGLVDGQFRQLSARDVGGIIQVGGTFLGSARSAEFPEESGRSKALRNLALRTGVEDVDTLVAMLIQAERFGTSIGASLRVHADSLRTKRRQRAEEAAAKIALKLLFPLIFCIFPSLLLVLLGPAFIQIYRILLPAFGGR